MATRKSQGAHRMGEGPKPLFEPTFNCAVKVRGGNERLTSDAGTLLLREADHRLDLIRSLAAGLRDRRDPDCVRYPFTELLRERLYAMAQGYDAQDDVDELAHDPAMRMTVSGIVAHPSALKGGELMKIPQYK